MKSIIRAIEKVASVIAVTFAVLIGLTIGIGQIAIPFIVGLVIIKAFFY